ncbi:MAG: glycoside hydrolase family 32 protein [Anaerolineaceae bacterium]|nr:glycoside hydrolase family 32 protein [Anaerolineaceae bacterium]
MSAGQEKTLQDHDRPVWHYLPEEGLLWDPCAAIKWQGRYHVFFLHSSWAQAGPPRRSDGYVYKAWAHISSSDLVNWERHPDALKRGQTGGLFVFKGTPTLIFPHPDGGGASCIASNPEGDLMSWRFYPRHPVLRHPVQGEGLYPRSNDVTAWQEGDWCYALTGTRDVSDGGDALYLFRSRDLRGWEYVDRFFQSQRRWTDAGDDCSCPQLFELGDKWMLLHFCHRRPQGYVRPTGSRFYLGHHRGQRFEAEAFGPINWPGGNFHAPRCLLDEDGRRILFANLHEGRSQAACERSGWSGVLSMPVVISLAPGGGTILYEPAAELEALRREPRELRDLLVEDDGELELPGIAGDSLELDVEFGRTNAEEFGLVLRRSPDGSEQTRISFTREGAALRIDFSRSGRRADLDYLQGRTLQEAPFRFDPETGPRLRLFLDRSVLELFAGRQRFLAQRIYPGPEATGVRLFSRGGATAVGRLRAWRLGRAS